MLGFGEDDPVEGRLHVRSKEKADPDALPFEERRLEKDHLIIPADSWGLVDELPMGRLAKWRGGWKFFKRFRVEEIHGLARGGEPIHIDVQFEEKQVRDPEREIRLVEEVSEEEIPCQVYGQKTQEGTRICSIVFLADVDANEGESYLILYGNPSPACWTPSYRTDLITRGEGYVLEVENSYYKARLSAVMGQLRDLEFKRWGKTWLRSAQDPTPINVTDASNDPKSRLDIVWHGEDSCIHWNPDFMSQLRFRITLWPEPPNYSVVKGPICTIVKRWGYPISAIYPALPQSAVSIEVPTFSTVDSPTLSWNPESM